MGNIFSISVSDRNKEYLKENHISKSKIFAEALNLHRLRHEFLNIGSIMHYYDELLRKQTVISFYQKEIERREETIDALSEKIRSLQNVLAEKTTEQR